MLSVRMLGVFTILMDGQRVLDELGPSGRMLSGYLFEFAGQMQRRERLADRFWGHLDAERARGALNTALWRLRKILAAHPSSKGGENLRTFGSEVVLDTAAWLDIDTHRFSAAIKHSLALPCMDLGSDLARLEQAIDSYTGPFLDGEDAHWILEERERLHSLYVRGASELLRIYGNTQRYEEGIAVARSLIARDPFRESIHRDLLLLLVLNGQRAEALRHHERWSASFRRELDIDPMPQTLKLVERLRSGRIFEQFDAIKASYFLPRSDKSQWSDEGGPFDDAVRSDSKSLPVAGRRMPHLHGSTAEKASNRPTDASRR